MDERLCEFAQRNSRQLEQFRRFRRSRNRNPPQSYAGRDGAAPAWDPTMQRESSSNVPIAMTIAEASRALSVSPMTIRRLLERGELRRVAVGRSVRVLAQSVASFAERGGVFHGK